MRFVLALVIASLVLYQNQAKRDFIIEVDDYAVNLSNSKIVKFESHNLYEKTMITTEFSLFKPIREFNFKLSFNVFTVKHQPMNFVTVSVACKSIASGKFPIFTLMFGQLERVSNLPLKNCIFLAETLYYVRNYTIAPDDFPPVIFYGPWKIVLEWYSGKTLAGTSTVIGRIVKK